MLEVFLLLRLLINQFILLKDLKEQLIITLTFAFHIQRDVEVR